MTSTQVMVSTSVNAKGSHATSAVGDKGVQTEDIMDEAATMHVDEADVGKKVYRNEDEQIMKDMTDLSKGKDGTLRILCGPGFMPIIQKERVHVKCESVASLKESMQVHARTKLENSCLFPNQRATGYHARIWRNNRTWKPWRIRRKRPACNGFISCITRNIQTPELHVLENRRRRSLHVRGDMFPYRPAMYVWKIKTKVADQNGQDFGCTPSQAGENKSGT